MIVRRPARETSKQREARAVENHKQAVQAAKDYMHAAQDRVRELKLAGEPYVAAAERARAARHRYLQLTGGTERREIAVDQGSAVNPLIAV
jgi:beta-phosphoglucomutase-like phosphatase (HAD superfamily)